MICRNCSALIEDGAEKCPVCHKDPNKHGRNGKGKVLVLVLVVLLLGAASFLVYSNFDLVKEKLGSFFPSLVNSNITTAAENGKDVPNEKETTKSESESETEKISLLKAEIIALALENESDDKLVLHGTISLQKPQLKALTETQFKDFCLKRVAHSSFAWLTLKCDDKTGIVFSGNCITTAAYGTLDENDYIKETLGIIILTPSGEYVYVPSDGSAKSVEASTAKGEAQTTVTMVPFDPNVTENTAPQKGGKDNAKVVFIEEGSSCYHKSSCKLLSKEKKSVEKSRAVKDGYTRCQKCKP